MTNKGQATVESVLLITLGLFIALTLTNAANNQKWLASFIERPWKNLDGMIQWGVWGGDQYRSAHFSPRRLSKQGDR